MKYWVMKGMLAIAAVACLLAAMFSLWSANLFWGVNPTLATSGLYSAITMFALAVLCEGCRAVINRFDD